MIKTTDFSSAKTPTPALIEHILVRYHETHRRELPDLIALADRVETIHANDPNAPHGLTQALEALVAELNEHMLHEEAVILATLDDEPSRKEGKPIALLRDEHVQQVAAMNKIAAITHGFRLPIYSCEPWTKLYAGLRKLIDDLEEHIFLENTVLFPRLETGK